MAVSAPNDTPTYAPSPLDKTLLVRGGVFTPANGSPSTYVPPYTGPSTPPPPSPGAIATTGYAQSPLPGAPSTGVYAPSNVSDPKLVAAASGAILHHESGSTSTKLNNPTSPAGARGPGQIMPATFKQYALPGEDINNPADNIAVHNRIMADYAKRWPNDPARWAVAYQSGPGNVAPPGSPTPWKRNVGDGNNTVSQYVANTAGRMGVATPNAGATAATPAAATGAKPSFADAAQKGDVGAMLQALTAEDAKGKSPLGSLGDNLSQNAGGSARGGGAQASTPMAYPAPQADYAGPAGQLMAQVTQLQNKPLSWSAAPFGAGAGMVPGTTLNS